MLGTPKAKAYMQTTPKAKYSHKERVDPPPSSKGDPRTSPLTPTPIFLLLRIASKALTRSMILFEKFPRAPLENRHMVPQHMMGQSHPHFGFKFREKPRLNPSIKAKRPTMATQAPNDAQPFRYAVYSDGIFPRKPFYQDFHPIGNQIGFQQNRHRG